MTENNKDLTTPRIYGTLDIFDEFIKGGVDVEFTGKNEIVLYTALNKTNTELLQKGKYDKIIKAIEYSNFKYFDEFNDQVELLVRLSYDTQNMLDTLHPEAYKYILDVLKKSKVRRDTLKDIELVNHILKTTNRTGVRVHGISTQDKAYKNTKCMFSSQGLYYYLKPDSVKVLGVREI